MYEKICCCCIVVVLLFFDDGDANNKALTHSLVISICVYFLLPITASLSSDVSCNRESIFSIPQVNNAYLLQSSSKAVLNFSGGINNDDGEGCCLCCCSLCFNSVSKSII
jgi:hypothetical protein